MKETHRRPDEALLEQLTDQLDRTRRLLTGGPDEAAEAVLARFTGQSEVEARIAADLAATEPLAQPEQFYAAHRLVMRALEVLDHHGSRRPSVPNLGPLKPIARQAVEYIARFIVRSYARGVYRRLRTLYARREAQAALQSPERQLLTRARLDVEHLLPAYSGNESLRPLLLGGLTLSLLGWLSHLINLINLGETVFQLALLGLLGLLFFAVSGLLLRGAAVAHRRSRLIMQQPLAALWETIGHCGNPPRDASRRYAAVAIALTAIVWFILPALAALAFVLT